MAPENTLSGCPLKGQRIRLMRLSAGAAISHSSDLIHIFQVQHYKKMHGWAQNNGIADTLPQNISVT